MERALLLLASKSDSHVTVEHCLAELRLEGVNGVCKAPGGAAMAGSSRRVGVQADELVLELAAGFERRLSPGLHTRDEGFGAEEAC